MGSRLPLVLLLLGAGAGTLALAFGLGRGEAFGEGDVPTSTGTIPGAEIVPASAPRLRGRGAPGAATTRDCGAPTSAEREPEATTSTLSLVVRVTGVPADHPAPVRVHLCHPPFVRAWGGREAIVAEGVARFDVTKAVRECGDPWVLVSTRHPDYVSEPAMHWFPAAPPTSRVYEVDVRMVRASVVQGRVVDAEGAPFPHAVVRLYALPDRADPSLPALVPCAEMDTGASGTYMLQATVPGCYLVAAHRPDGGFVASSGVFVEEDIERLPDGRAVDLDPAHPVRAPDLVLRPPHAIEGRLLVRGRAWPAARVQARYVRGARDLRVDSGDWPWWIYTGMDLVPWKAYEHVENGEFRLPCVAAGPYDVSAAGSRGRLDPAVMDASRTRVLAPCTGVVIDLDAVLVRVEARGPSGLVDRAWVHVVGAGKPLGCAVRDDRPAWFLLRPGARYTVRVTARGYTERESEFTVPVDQDEATWTLELTPAPEPAAREGGCLRVRVRAYRRDAMPFAEVVLQSEDGVRRTLGHTDEDARLVADEVPPGRHTVHATPGDCRRFSEGAAHPYAIPAATEVLVRPGETTEVEIPFGVGGLLEIAARDAWGRPVAADVTIREVGGRDLEVVFIAPDLYGDDACFVDWECCRGRLLAGLPSVTARALPAGPYRIEISRDGRPVHHERVEIVAGEVTRLDVALEGPAARRTSAVR